MMFVDNKILEDNTIASKYFEKKVEDIHFSIIIHSHHDTNENDMPIDL